MDENGNVFDKTGYLQTIDISSDKALDINPSLEANTLAASQDESIVANALAVSQDPNTINGANTGAFIRQTSTEGYIGIYSTLVLPTKTSGAMNIKTSTTGYLYNKLNYLVPGTSGYFDMEGGLQYSYDNDNYSPYIRVNGGSLNFKDITGVVSPRFKSNTTLTQRLRYENAAAQVKYYANGTNINGNYHSLIFAAAKTFTSTEQSKLRVGRVTGLAYAGTYTGAQSLGKIDVTYSNTKLTYPRFRYSSL